MTTEISKHAYWAGEQICHRNGCLNAFGMDFAVPTIHQAILADRAERGDMRARSDYLAELAAKENLVQHQKEEISRLKELLADRAERVAIALEGQCGACGGIGGHHEGCRGETRLQQVEQLNKEMAEEIARLKTKYE